VTDKPLAQVVDAIISSWGQETMYATKEPSRGPGDLSRGQCGTTALVLQDWMGGQILAADVSRDGQRVGVHYWNLLPGDLEVDLTGGQFLPNEALGPPRMATRPADGTWGDHPGYAPYALLRERVAARLGASTAHGGAAAQ
jgi:hypothetical protein